jgi:hypothetical protein
MALPTSEDLRAASRIPIFFGLGPETVERLVERLIAPTSVTSLKRVKIRSALKRQAPYGGCTAAPRQDPAWT